MTQEKRPVPVSLYGNKGDKNYQVHSFHFAHNPEEMERLFQYGTASDKMELGTALDKGEQPTNSRQPGEPTNHMGKTHYGRDRKLHPLPTKQDSFNAREGRKAGKDLKGWQADPRTANIEPWNDDVDDSGWLKAGESEHPSRYDVEPAKYNRLGRGLSVGAYRNAAANPSWLNRVVPTYREDEQKLDVGAKATLLDIYTHSKPKKEPESSEKPLLYERLRNSWRHFWGLENSHDSPAKSTAAHGHSPGQEGNLEQRVKKENSHEGIGHKVGEAAAEIADFVAFVAR